MIFANIAQISNMDNIYMFMLIAITVLATIDIVVGVSNDAINFLNSAIGSKAILPVPGRFGCAAQDIRLEEELFFS